MSSESLYSFLRQAKATARMWHHRSQCESSRRGRTKFGWLQRSKSSWHEG